MTAEKHPADGTHGPPLGSDLNARSDPKTGLESTAQTPDLTANVPIKLAGGRAEASGGLSPIKINFTAIVEWADSGRGQPLSAEVAEDVGLFLGRFGCDNLPENLSGLSGQPLEVVRQLTEEKSKQVLGVMAECLQIAEAHLGKLGLVLIADDEQSPFGEEDSLWFSNMEVLEKAIDLAQGGDSQTGIVKLTAALVLAHGRANGVKAIERFLALLNLPPLAVLWRKTAEELATEAWGNLRADKEGAAEFVQTTLDLDGSKNSTGADYLHDVSEVCGVVEAIEDLPPHSLNFMDITSIREMIELVSEQDLDNGDLDPLTKAGENLYRAALAVAFEVNRPDVLGENQPETVSDQIEEEAGGGEATEVVKARVKKLGRRRKRISRVVPKVRLPGDPAKIARHLGLFVLAIAGSFWGGNHFADDGSQKEASSVEPAKSMVQTKEAVDRARQKEMEKLDPFVQGNLRYLAENYAAVQKQIEAIVAGRAVGQVSPLLPELGQSVPNQSAPSEVPRAQSQTPSPEPRPTPSAVRAPENQSQTITTSQLSSEQIKKLLGSEIKVRLDAASRPEGFDTVNWAMNKFVQEQLGLDLRQVDPSGLTDWLLVEALAADGGRQGSDYNQVADGQVVTFKVGENTVESIKLADLPVATDVLAKLGVLVREESSTRVDRAGSPSAPINAGVSEPYTMTVQASDVSFAIESQAVFSGSDLNTRSDPGTEQRAVYDRIDNREASSVGMVPLGSTFEKVESLKTAAVATGVDSQSAGFLGSDLNTRSESDAGGQQEKITVKKIWPVVGSSGPWSLWEVPSTIGALAAALKKLFGRREEDDEEEDWLNLGSDPDWSFWQKILGKNKKWGEVK